ncbi:MAG: hypothetical protein ABI467_01345 [Kofleriaceae bacterium]
MADLAKENAILEAQRAYFASDEHIKERGSAYRTMTPQDCLEIVAGMCRDSAWFMSLKSPDELARLESLRALPDSVIATLERLQKR